MMLGGFNFTAFFLKQYNMNYWKGHVIIGNACKIKYLPFGVFISHHTKSLIVHSEEYVFIKTYHWSVSSIERHGKCGKKQNCACGKCLWKLNKWKLKKQKRQRIIPFLKSIQHIQPGFMGAQALSFLSSSALVWATPDFSTKDMQNLSSSSRSRIQL